MDIISSLSTHNGKMLAVVFCISCFVIGSSAQCYEVKFKNAMYQSSANGVYNRYPETYCDGRDVYKHEYNEMYMFFIDGWWCIYSSPCSSSCYLDSGKLRSPDWSQYPEYIFSTWQERSGGLWYYNYAADVDCSNNTNLSTGAIIGIVIACLAALFLIAGGVYYACKKKKSPQPHVSTVTTRATPYAPTAAVITVDQPAQIPVQPYAPPATAYPDPAYPNPAYPNPPYANPAYANTAYEGAYPPPPAYATIQ